MYVEGKLRTRKWQDKEGQDRYTTEVIGDVMQMLGSREGMGGGGGDFDGGEESRAPARSSSPSSANRSAREIQRQVSLKWMTTFRFKT